MIAARSWTHRIPLVVWGWHLLTCLVTAHAHPPESLGIGQVAPDITGVDVDGKAFKLSDYRGKIVVLDFWGDW